jgi:NTE family protein
VTSLSPTSAPAAEHSASARSAAAGQAAGILTDAPQSVPAPARPTVLQDHPRAEPSRPGRPHTAFVFAGNASLGAAQAGTVRALYEHGIEADTFVGTSAGAFNAAYLATRSQTVRTAVELGRLWSGLHREDLLPLHPLAVIGGLTNHRDHLVSDAPLRRLISRHLGLPRLEQANAPLHLVCFDLLSGEEVRLSERRGMDAMLAATAVPGLLPPSRGVIGCWAPAAS